MENNFTKQIQYLYEDIFNNTIDIQNEQDYNNIKQNIHYLNKISSYLHTLKNNYEKENDISEILENRKRHREIIENNNDSKAFTYLSEISNLSCYVCKYKCSTYHDYYKKMCQTCGNINMLKRQFSTDLTNKIAIITGGRVKIGYETALKLLRCNCKVIITSRFAKDALLRYSQENDYEKWINNLKIFEANFLNISDIKSFIEFIFSNYTKIDFLINNAAQTIARPNDFYKHLLNAEPDKKLITQCIQNNTLTIQNNQQSLQIIDTINFPIGQMDKFGQQIDLRDNNSWMKEIDEIDLKECLEVQAINAIVPYTLISKLMPLLKKNNPNEYSWIINVTSMEGIFDTHKTTHHVHTNMSKASLNMITKTCGRYLSKYNIILCGVETGWNNPQQPLSYEFNTPLDCIDGASRILDPIFNKLTKHSVIYKDYKICNF